MLTGVVGLPSAGAAQTVWNTGNTGSWFQGQNWSAGVPQPATDATVGNGGTAQVDTGGTGTANLLTIDSGSAVEVINGSTLAISGATGAGSITLDDGTLRSSAAAGTASTYATGIAIGSGGGTIDSNGSVPMALAGALTSSNGGGLLTLTNSVGDPPGGDRPDDIILSGSNSNTGGVSIVGRTYVTANGNDVLGSGNLTMSAGADLGIAGDFAEHVATLNGQGSISASGYGSSTGVGNASLSVKSGNYAGRLHNGFSNQGGNSNSGVLSLTKVSDGTASGGTLVLSGTTNNYSGGTTIEGGTIRITTGQALGAGSVTLNGGILQSGVSAGTQLVIDNAIVVGGSGGRIDSNGATLVVLNGAISSGSNAAPLTFSGTNGNPDRNFDFVLYGANTSTAGTVVSAGTQVVTRSEDGLGSGSLTVASGGTFAMGAVNQTATTLNGGGDIFANGYQGATAVTTSTLTVGSGAFGGRLYDGVSNEVINGVQRNYAGVLALTKTTSGTLLLSGAAGYTGQTQVTGGTLQAGSTTAFSAQSAFAVTAGAMLDLGGYSNSVGSLAGAGTVTNSGSSAATLGVGGDNTSTTFSGLIQDGSGGVGLTKTGTGIFTVSGQNTFSGGTTIYSGTVQIGNDIALGSGAVTLAAGTLQAQRGINLDVSNNIVVGAGGGTIDANNGSLSLHGSISDGADPGVLTFANTNSTNRFDTVLYGVDTHTGGTVIAGGAYVLLAAAGALSNGALTVQADGGFLIAGHDQSLAILNGQGFVGNGGAVLNGAPGASHNTLTVAAGDFSGTIFDGTSSNNQGNYTGTIALVKTTSGTLNLSGSSSYSGGTLLQGGTIGVGDDQALGSGVLTMSDGTTLRSLQGVTIANDIVLNGTDTINTAGPGSPVRPFSGGFDSEGVVSGSGTLVKTGALGLRLSGNNTYSGGTLVEGGHIGINNNNALGTGTLTFAGGFLTAHAGGFTVGNAAILAQNGAIDTQSFSLTYAGQISGPGALTKLGTGTLALTNTNTFTGGTVVSQGTVQVTNSTLSPPGTTLSSSVGTGAVTLAGGTLQFAANGNEVDFANTIQVGAGGGTIDSNGSYPRLSGNIVDGATPGTLTFRNAVGRLGSKVDFILSGNNTFSGGLVVNRSTDIAIAADNAGGRGALTVNGVFDLGSHNQTFTSLSGTGYVNATGLFGATATTAVTLSVQSGDFAGGLFQGTSDYPDRNGTVVHTAGVLGLTKISDGTADGGTLTLSGYTALYDANAYSGPTLIQAGTIRAGSTSALSSKSDFTLADAGNLDLNGFSNAIGSLAGTGAVYNDGATAATLTVGRTGASTTFSGFIVDDVSPLAVTKVGLGTFTPDNYNSYTGGTVIAGGTVVLSRLYIDPDTLALYRQEREGRAPQSSVPNAQTLVAQGARIFSSVGAGPITLDGGALRLGDGGFDLVNDVIIGLAGGTLDSNGHTDVPLDGFIQDSAEGPGTLFYANSGDGGAHIGFLLSRTNTFTGQSVILNNAFVSINKENALGVGALQVDAGGTFDLGDFNQTVTRLTGQGLIEASGSYGVIPTGSGVYPTGLLDTLTVQSGSFGGTLADGTLTETAEDGSGDVFTFSATLGLTKTSDGSPSGGTLLLSGTSTYSGPTTVIAGTLQAGSATAFSPNSPFTIAAAGTLDLAGYSNVLGSLAGAGQVTNSGAVAARLTTGGNGTSTTFSGILADGTAPLQLLKTGTGELTLSGANSYSGGTKLNAGTIGVGSATAFGTGLVSMADGTALDFLGSYTIANAFDFPVVGDPTFDTGPNTVVISGPISGPGALTKLGTGTLDLTAVNTYTGPTDVVQGRLVVDGSVANSTVTVENGASLGGSGLLGGLTVDSGGTLAPGSLTPFSTLRVGGSGVTFQAGSTYQVRINAAGQTDSLTTPGAATILGGTVAVLVDPGVYTPTQAYTILAAGGGVTGRFDTLTTASTLAFLTPDLTYGTNAVTLGFSQTQSLAAAAVTPNQVAVANAIQSLGAGNRLSDAVLGQDAAGARQAFTAASGEAHASTVTTAVVGARQVSSIVFDRLWNIAGSDDFDALQVLGQFGPTTLPTLLRCYQPMPSTDKTAPSTYTVWGQGIGSFGRSGGDGNAASVDRTLGGFAFGADTKLDVAGLEKWRVGLSGGYTNNGFTVGSGGGAGTYESIFGTLYGGARYGSVDVRLGASYGGTQTNLRRTVAFPGFSERESSSYGGSSIQGFGEIGYRFALGETVLEPVVSGSVVSIHEDGYREKGGAAALQGFAEDTLIGTTTVGFRNEASPFGEVPLVTRLFLGWQHTYGDVNPASTVAFASGSTAFQTYGSPADRNAAVAEAGIDWRATSALSVSLSYIGAIGDRDHDNGVKGRADYRF